MAIKEKLQDIYNQIPSTKGCEENIFKEGGCGAWCCQMQNPHVLNCEFNNAKEHFLSKFSNEEIVSLFKRALINYFSVEIIKGCIFWNSNTRLCSIHEARPLNCRIYGITPEEEIKPRIDRLRVLYNDPKGTIFKDQCNLVSTVNDKPITKADTDKWWTELKNVEMLLGYKDEDINDKQGGSYRTYHEYMIMSFCDDKTLLKISDVKKKNDKKEIDSLIEILVTYFEKYLSNERKN